VVLPVVWCGAVAPAGGATISDAPAAELASAMTPTSTAR
jgi:hypothetical protein